MVLEKEASRGVEKGVEGAFSPTPDEPNKVWVSIDILPSRAIVDCIKDKSDILIHTLVTRYRRIEVEWDSPPYANTVKIYGRTIIVISVGDEINLDRKYVIDRILVGIKERR